MTIITHRKTSIKNILFISIFSTLTLSAVQIEFKDITSKIIPIKKCSKVYYQLSADRYIEKFSKKDKIKFIINMKSYMLKNNYYSNGIFQAKNVNLSFKNSYVLFGKVYLFDVSGKIENREIKAKEIVFNGYKTYLLKRCEVVTSKRIYRRKKFKLILN